eukprot:Em0001g2268a
MQFSTDDETRVTKSEALPQKSGNISRSYRARSSDGRTPSPGHYDRDPQTIDIPLSEIVESDRPNEDPKPHPTPSEEAVETNDLDKIHDGIGDKMSIFIQFVATFFGGLVISFVRSWKVALLLLAFIPILALCASAFAKQRPRSSMPQQELLAEEVLSSIRTVVALGGEQKEVDRHNLRLKEAGWIGAKKGFANGTVLALIFFIIYSLYAVVFWFGGYLISVKQINSGDLLTSFFALIIGAFSLGQAAPNMENLMTAAGASVSIYETIDRIPPIDSDSDEGEIPESFDSAVEFKDVQFSYPNRPDVQILTGFSMKISVGKTVALVGPSGCGKSTVIQLLQRFYDPSGGEVFVGGRNIRTLNLKWLRRHIGLVSQEPVLFDTTIAENIRFGREDATLSDIEKAAREANVHDFIASLPNGYNTLVGERGVQLSGGQKQRVAIARALVRDPKLLLLDEATSALDTESESVVQEALDKARSGRTTIVIAHRLSTIQNADLIIAIEEGQVAEMGTHAELIQQKGLYFNLVVAQLFAFEYIVTTCFQSYGDIDVTQMALVPRKFVRSDSIRSTHSAKLARSSSTRGSKRHRDASGSEETTPAPPPLTHQQSQSNKSAPSNKIERVTSKALQEQWDKEIPVAPLTALLKKNAPEWWMIGLGLIGSMVAGAVTPLFSIFFGRILGVFSNPPEKVFPLVHPWAGLFLALATVTASATFLKVVCFTISGERLTLRLRSETFHAILKQEIGWFDDQRNSTGALVTRKSLTSTVVYGVTYGFSQGVLFFGYVIAFRFGAFLVALPLEHKLYSPFNDIFVVFLALVFGAMAAGQAGAFAPNYAKARLSANRIFALLNRLPATSVYFSEEGAKPDRLLALVGPSGCGKSTVVSLLERFYEPKSGCLKLDQQDIRDLNIQWLRQNIGLVSQEPILFDTSIAENIRYGANFREVSDDEVIAAAQAANIHNFIETLPEGYNTNVGAKGTQLSGGQKQRIAIARALVRNPRILLLDEATSALDTESEKVVQEALDKAREGRTSIVIAHRLSTIYNADVIAVIKGGQVAESGKHEELMKKKGLYYKLNRYQMLVEEPEYHSKDTKDGNEEQLAILELS